MHVGVFCLGSRLDSARPVLDACEHLEITATAITAGAQLGPAVGRPDGLKEFTHFVAVASAVHAQPSAAAFLLGVAAGTGVPVAVFVDAPTVIPRVFKNLTHLISPEQAARWLSARSHEHLAIVRREVAIERIRAAGLGIDPTSFVRAVEHDDPDVVDSFFALGYRPDTMTPTAVPVLSHAVRSGSHRTVRLLLDRGADPNARAPDRDTFPVTDAASAGDLATVVALLSAGAAVDSRTGSNQTALMIAVGNDDTDMCTVLLERGADPDITDNVGMSARKYAGLFKRTSIVAAIEQLDTPPERT